VFGRCSLGGTSRLHPFNGLRTIVRDADMSLGQDTIGLSSLDCNAPESHEIIAETSPLRDALKQVPEDPLERDTWRDTI
jgi:hypothetical protein